MGKNIRKIRKIRTEQNNPRITRITRMQMNGDSVRSERSVQNNKRETTRNTHFGQKESERETHKLNIFLCSKEVSYVILRKFLHDFGHSA